MTRRRIDPADASEARLRAQEGGVGPHDVYDPREWGGLAPDDSYPPACSNPEGHEWTSGYAEDDDGDEHEVGIRCVWCGADGDA